MKHTYNYSKPKFCSGCGHAIGVSLAKVSAPKKPSYEEEDEEYDDEDPDNTDNNHVPSIRKLQVEVENYSESNRFSLGSIFGQNSSETVSARRRRTSSVDEFINSKNRGE
jgi:hypothetical protein